MTKCYLDNDPLETAGPALRDALEAASARAASRGRIVVEVIADGSPLADHLLADPPATPLHAAELRFTSAEPRAMVRTVLLDVADAMAQVRTSQQAAATEVQSGRMDAARAHLAEAMDLWSAAQRAVSDGSTLLQIDLAAVTVPATGATADATIDALRTDLAELQRALADEDASALADVLAYDLDQRAHHWHALMTHLAETIDAARG